MVESVAPNPGTQRNELAGQVDAVAIARPAAGELRVVDVERGGEIDFDFPVDSVRVIALDVDIIFAFSDGAKILLPHFGLMLTGPNPPKLRFSGRSVRSMDMLSTITEVTQSDLTASISNISEPGKEKEQQAEAAPSSSSAAAPLIKLSAPRIDEPTLAQAMAPATPQPISITRLGAAASSSAGSYAANLTGDGANLYSTTSTALTAKIYNLPDSRSDVNPNDPQGRVIYGGTGPVGSDKSSTYEAQVGSRVVTGTTDHNDTVFLDDPQLAQTQSSARKVVVDLAAVPAGFTATQILISDPPSGFVIMNGTKTAAGTLLDIDEGGKTVTLTLSYKLPADNAGVNSYGYYSINRLTIQTQMINQTTGATDSQSNDLFFGIAKVQNGGPLEAQIAGVPGTIYTLWTNPPGSSVDLGAGDDAVYMSAGADTVTGGAGLDTLNYSRSSAGVSVDLGARTAKGGFAQGDIINDVFENLVGSIWSDSLVGSSGNNTINSYGNADTVDGRDGVDTLDFAWSNLGVTLDLSSTKRQTGDGVAEGMIVQNVENVVGAARVTNYLVGSTANNLLKGGSANDTFVGSAGLDTYIGGGGQDIVDFRASTSSVSVVADDAGTGANATQHFENIKTIYGAKNASNFIAVGVGITDAVIGGDQADTLSGSGGAGSIIAGLGNDSVYASGQYTVLGGSGNDSYSANSASSALLDYSYATTSAGITLALGNSAPASVVVSGDDIDQVSGFENIIATSGNDCLTGSSAANYIDAGAGADTIIAGSANDASGNGNDTFIGGNNAGDMIDYTYVVSTGLTITLGQTAFTTLSIGVNNVDLVSGFKSFRGGGGNDLIIGDASDNTISGAGGVDSLMGGGQTGDWISYRYATSGATVVFGANRAVAGGATVSGTDMDRFIGFQNVLGSGYADSLVLDLVDNTVQAAAGNDTIVGGLGNDSIDGGDGNDIASYAYVTDNSLFVLSDTVSTISIAANDVDRLVNVEGIIAGSGNDTIVGNSLANLIRGGDGNDSFFVSRGNDTFDGGNGLDILSYLDDRVSSVTIDIGNNSVAVNFADNSQKTDYITNIERVVGTRGSDAIFGSTGDNSLVGNLGNDTISGGFGDDTIDGGVGNDSLIGGPAYDAGLSDNDLFIGSDGSDTINGGVGVNTIDYGNLTVALVADVSSTAYFNVAKDGVGNDSVTAVSNIFGGSGNDCITGDGAANWFLGGAGDDTLLGGAGDDTLGGGDGNDSLDGGDGVDYVDLSYVKTGITWAMSGTSVSLSPTDIDTIVNFENIRGGQGDDSLRGNAANNVIDGYLGKNTLAGDLGNDTLYGDADDLVDYSDAASNIVYTLGSAASITVGVGNVDRVEGFGNIVTGSGADRIRGTSSANYIDVGAGNDSVLAGTGDDTVRGGLGNDTLSGGGDANDLLDYSYVASGAGGLSVSLNGLTFVAASVSASDNDSISGFANIIGTVNNDTIFGDNQANTIIGGGGADCIRGGDGNDWLDGGASSGDTIDYAYTSTGVRFALGQTNTVSVSTTDNDTASGFENFFGGSGGDTVITDALANTVRLNDGADSLYVSIGNDSYDGGNGRDSIDFSGISGALSVSMSGATASYYVQSGSNWVLGGTFTNFENLNGTSGDDSVSMIGNVAYSLAGAAGADTLMAGGLAATIDGGSGADSMGRNDALVTNDVYYIDDANDSIIDGRGNDTAFVSQSDFAANTNVQVGTFVYSGNDRFNFLGASANVFVDATNAVNGANLIGGTGNETMRGGAGRDSIDGGAGNDYIYAGLGNDTLRGGAGDNTLDYSYLGAGTGLSLTLNGNGVATAYVGANDIDQIDSFLNVVGSSGNDTIQGDANANTINAGDGDDSINASLGNDTVDGGAGNNIANYLNLDQKIYNVGFSNVAVGYVVTITNKLTQEVFTQRVFNAQIVGGTGSVTFDITGNTPQTLMGQAGDDTMFGGGGNDSILGLSGNDLLQGRGGSDTIDGGDETDQLLYDYTTIGISANLSTGTVSVAPGDIDLIRNIENISGTSGNDTFVGATGNNILNGRGGTDLVSYEYVTDVTPLSIVIAESGSFAVSISANDIDTLINIEGVIGGAGNDTIVGNTQANMIGGAGGDDLILANDGNDTLIGALGNDTLDGGSGTDIITYANLSATSVALSSSGSDVTVAFYNGTTLLKTDILRNIEQFFGANASETINASGLADAGPLMFGGIGNDSLIGNGFANTLFGGAGADTIRGGLGNDSVDGGTADGVDWIDYGYATGGVSLVLNNTIAISATVAGGGDFDRLVNIENVIGSNANDSLFGDLRANILLGGLGNDSLSGGAGNDTLDGGNGTDNLSYIYAASAVSLTLNGTIASSASVSATDIDSIVNFENVLGSVWNDTIVGDSGANSIAGITGNDCLFGGDGADTIASGPGNDTIDGGAGIDLLDIGYTAAASSVNLATGRSSVTGGGDADFLSNFENVTSGAGADTIIGDGNNNSISSGAGADTVSAGQGDDTVSGGFGNDTLDGGDGADWLDYSYQANVFVDLVAGRSSIAANTDNDFIANFESVRTLGGNDTLYGDGGANTLTGGTGTNILDGRGGSDWVSYGFMAPGAGIWVRLNGALAGSGTLTGTIFDTLYNIENVAGSDNNDSITGDTLSNILLGAGGADSLSGAAGDDCLVGGTGNDTLSGGTGNDTLDGSGAGGLDVASYSYVTTALTLSLSGTTTNLFTIVAGSDVDTVYNIEGLIGGSAADSLTGDSLTNLLSGGAGNDTFAGRGGNDTFDGGADNDVADYAWLGAGASLGITGTVGNLTVAAYNSAGLLVSTDVLLNMESIALSGRADMSGTTTNLGLIGSAGADTLIGGSGANTFFGGAGNDRFDGRSSPSGSVDVADYSYVTTGLSLALSGTTLNLLTIAAGTDVDTLLNIEGLIGGSGNDTLTGDSLANYLGGGLGDDSFTVSNGNDTVDGGAGTDTYDFGSDYSVVDLSGTGQTITATLVNALGQTVGVQNLSNFENFIGVNGNINLSTLTTGVQLFNRTGGKSIITGSGADTFIAYGDGQVINLGAGRDNITYLGLDAIGSRVSIALDASSNLTAAILSSSGVLGNADTLVGVENFQMTSGNDTFAWGAATNALWVNGGAGNDSILGGSGNDTFIGGLGNDTIDGGAGVDVVDYSYLTTNLNVTLNNLNTDLVNLTYVPMASTFAIAPGEVDRLINVEGIISGSGNDTITMTPTIPVRLNVGSNPVYGFSHLINTGDGDDRVNLNFNNYYLGGGVDTVDGGSGVNTLDLTAITSGVTVNLQPGANLNSFAISIFGYSPFPGANVLSTSYTAATRQSLAARVSNFSSYLLGAGTDCVTGSSNNDTIDGGGGSDLIDYSYYTTAGLGLNVNLSTSGSTNWARASVALGEVDTIRNFESLIGTGANDTINASSASSAFYLAGGAGDDIITGGSGNDTLSGGAGNDTLDGGGGSNIVDYSYLQAGQTLTITALNATTWSASVSGSTLAGEIDTLYRFGGVSLGNSKAAVNFNQSAATTAQTLAGGAGSDTLLSGSGNDSISTGTGGSDSLDGGAGRDTLITALLDPVTGGTNNPYTTELVVMDGARGTLTGNGQTVSFANFEYLTLSNFNINNSTLPGDAFVGSATTNSMYIYGWGGNDTLDDGGGSNMTLDGWVDSDVYFIRSATTQVNDGFANNYGNLNTINTTLTSIDLSSAQYGTNFISNLNFVDATASTYANGWGTTAGSGDYTGIGNALNNLITGGSGNDVFVGGAGADTLIGNAGADRLIGYDTSTSDGNSANRSFSPSNFDSGNWVKSGLSVAANSATILAPNGTPTADIVSANAINAMHYIVTPYFNGVSPNTPYVGTLYARGGSSLANGAQFLQVAMGGLGFDATQYANIDLNTGAIVAGNLTAASNFSVTTSLENGWVTITINAISSAFSGNANITYSILESNIASATPTYLGTGKSVALWGGTWVVQELGDSLSGGSGNDTLSGGAGNDTMDGGSDNDVADYSYLTTGTTFNMAQFGGASYQTVSVAPGDVDFVRNIEGLIGTTGDDSILGDAKDNYLGGAAGNDTFVGGLGNDTIDGGAGSDTIDYSSRTTALSIVLNGANAISVAVDANEFDLLVNIENIRGGSGDDTLTGDANANVLSGGMGNDMLDGGAGAGADVADYSYLTTGVTFDLANFNTATWQTVSIGLNDVDQVRNFEGLISGSGNDSLLGDAVANYLGGGAGADTIMAGDGNDTIVGGLGNDSLDGGTGLDTLDYSSRLAGTNISVTLSGSNWVTVNLSTGETDVITNIENISGGGGNDTLTGDSLTNRLSGGAGNDSLFGAAGADTLSGGLGYDTIDGGTGSDVIDYSYLTVGVTLNLNNMSGVNYGTVGVGFSDFDLVRNVEGLIAGSGDDCLYGDNAANYIDAGLGNDTIYDDGGNDTVLAGGGNDLIYANGGSDLIDGGDGIDTMTYQFRTSGVSVVLLDGVASSAYPSGLEVDTLLNIENITGSNAAADTIVGNSASNTILGLIGNDSIDGGAGNDYLDGGADTDTLTYASRLAGTNVSVTLSGANAVTAAVDGSEKDIVLNFENVIGGAGNDTLGGDSNSNWLQGGAGNDSLFGGGVGNDTLWGGSGDDIIQIDRVSSSVALMKVDGGTGTDTVKFAQEGTYSGTDLAAAITNVEVLDFRNSLTNTVSLSSAQISAMAGLNSNNLRELTLNLDSNDSVSIDIDSSLLDQAANGSNTDVTIYTDATKSTVQAILHLVPG